MPTLPPAPTEEGIHHLLSKWIEQIRQILRPIPTYKSGAGSPEGSVTGEQGDRYFRTDGAAGTYVYVKTTAGGNTGWQAIG